MSTPKLNPDSLDPSRTVGCGHRQGWPLLGWRRHRRWLAGCLGLLVAGVCSAQVDPASSSAEDPWGDALANERLQSWGIEDGLTARRVYGLAQDPRGFLWIATQNGLNRFDGERIVAYHHDPTDPTSLGNNYLLSVYADDEGIVWLGTAAGFERFDPETATATHFLPDPDDPVALPGPWVQKIRPRRAGGLWLATQKGLAHFDPESQRFTTIPLGEGTEHADDLWVVDVLELASEERWIATTKSLVRQTADGRELERHPLGISSPGRLLRDHRGTFWVTAVDGLARWTPGTSPEVLPLAPSGSPARHTLDLFEDADRRLWVATLGGVFVLDAEHRVLRHLRHRPGERDGLRDDLVLCLVPDRSGGLWLGSNHGLNRFDPLDEAFRVYRHRPGEDASLSPTTVLALEPSASGGLWVGHQGGGLDRLDFAGHRIEHFRHRDGDPTSISHNVVWAVVEDSEGSLWVGTENGLDLRRPGEKRFRSMPLAAPGTSGQGRVLTLEEGTDGVLWAGAGQGLYRCRLDGCAQVENYATEFPILALLEGPGETLWIGTDNGGLQRLETTSLKVESWRHRPGDPSSLSHDVVGALHLDAEGHLWVGSSAGLQRFDAATETFERFDLGAPAPVKGILGFNGALWMSTHRDLLRLQPASRELERFGTAQGLPVSYSLKAAAHGTDGSLYFGGADVVAVTPDQIERDASAPGVALTGVWVGEEPVPLRQTETVGREVRYEAVQVGYRASSLSVELATLHFAAPQLNRSAYLLEGFDTDWVEMAPGQRRIRYTNLDPGTYLLRARGRSPSGVWSREVTTLAVVVEAPPWRTPWAYAGYGVSILLLTWWLVATQQRKVRDLRERVATQLELLQAGRDLERISAERGRLVVELEARRDELTVLQRTLSHDLRNPLTTIANFVGLLRRSTDGGDARTLHTLDRIDHATRSLDRLLSGMLDYSQLAGARETSRRVAWGELFRQACERAAASSPEHEVAVEIDEHLPVRQGDPERWRIVAQALVENAFQFTRGTAGARVEIRHRQTEGASRITVSDNGPGIEVEYHERVFELFEQLDPSTPGSGVGLAMAKRIVEDDGGRIWIEPRLPEEPGCSVTFEIPDT